MLTEKWVGVKPQLAANAVVCEATNFIPLNQFILKSEWFGWSGER